MHQLVSKGNAPLGCQAIAPTLCEALTRACALTDQVFAEVVGHVHGLRRGEFALLQAIAGNPGGNQKELAAAVGVSAPHVSVVLDRMLERGLVERLHSSSDGRQRCIQLTCQGQELAQQANSSLLHGEALAFAVLSPAERSFLGELLLRLAPRSRACPTIRAPILKPSRWTSPLKARLVRGRL